jgi:hypothetical protein
MLAPIGLSVYSRLDHLKQTVEALRKNTLAAESRLFVFSDAPRPGDEKAVNEVRSYLREIGGFSSVDITERTKNSRVANNREGMRTMLDTFGVMIWLEEDIVTAPGFLEFMNGALISYKNEDRVISITGYTPPIEFPRDYPDDVFFLQRFNAWGFGIWSNKFDRIEMKVDPADYRINMRDRGFYQKLVNNGLDIPRMIDMEVSGKTDALDVKIMYQQVLHDWYTVYPMKSLAQNIGHDGSGLHCRETDKFHHNELWKKTGGFIFPENVTLDDRIVSANRKFRRIGLVGNMTERVRYLRTCMSR